jgi:phospholipase C
VQWNNGACDGFIKSDSGNDDYALGYYVESQLPTNSYLARNFTVCDHWFASILGPTYPNRFYTHSAATDRISNTTTQSTMATIWDSLTAAGVSANYYFSDLPFIGLYGPKYAPISRRIDHFFVDAALGTLPSYSYLDPYFLGESQGASNDDHPHADIRRGQNFIGRVVDALIASPAWPSTVLIVIYDEWGGFFDHVPPPTLPDAYVPTATEEHNTAGFRVPAYVVSPFSPVGVVNSTQFDHSSILKLVEWRFGLAPLTPRDAASNDIADILDFSKPNLTPAPITVPTDPGPDLCTGVAAVDDAFWQELAASPLIKDYTGVA